MEELFGVIRMITLGKGSFHERLAPVLEGEHGQALVIIVGENPLVPSHLKQYQGKSIQVSGIWNRGVLHCSSTAVALENNNSTHSDTVEKKDIIEDTGIKP